MPTCSKQLRGTWEAAVVLCSETQLTSVAADADDLTLTFGWW